MRISIDAGSLNASRKNRFGTYVVTENIIHALDSLDQKNIYTCYLMTQRKNLRHMRFVPLRPSFLWKILTGLAEIIRRGDIYLALNQFIPMFHAPRIISFSHGLSFHFFPQLYPDSSLDMKKQVAGMIQKSETIVVSSLKVQREFKSIYGVDNVSVIPFGVPADMIRLEEKRKKDKYFLFVGMDHSIKNVQFIVSIFRTLRLNNKYKNHILYLIGNFDHTLKEENVVILTDIGRARLKHMYRHAAAYLTASRYESFNLPVVEALSQECPVIGLKSAIIPELAPYVRVVSTKKEFGEAIRSLEKNQVAVDRKKVLKEFSWDTYAKKLVSLMENHA